MIFFSDISLDLSGHVIDHALRSFKLHDLNVLENSRFFFFKNLYLTWLYVVLNGDSESILFFRLLGVDDLGILIFIKTEPVA